MEKEAKTELNAVPESGIPMRLREVAPKVDLHESEQGFRLWADLPGVAQAALDVRLEDQTLTIEGRVPGDGDASVGRGQRFLRRFSVPQDVESDEIKATLSHGVLEVYLPKGPGSKPRRIDILEA